MPYSPDFGQDNFPPVSVPGSEQSHTQELYPENIQDRINNYYGHDKSLPRRQGVDYIANQIPEDVRPEEKSTFPYKY